MGREKKPEQKKKKEKKRKEKKRKVCSLKSTPQRKRHFRLTPFRNSTMHLRSNYMPDPLEVSYQLERLALMNKGSSLHANSSTCSGKAVGGP